MSGYGILKKKIISFQKDFKKTPKKVNRIEKEQYNEKNPIFSLF